MLIPIQWCWLQAAGFAALRGYDGRQHQFELQLLAGQGAEWLPTAATCFNTLKLSHYGTEVLTRERLITAITNASGFDEGAVAH